MSPKPKERLEDVLIRARERLNGAAGLPFPTELLPEDDAGTKVTVPSGPEKAPAPADTPHADNSGRHDDRGDQEPGDPGTPA